MARRPRPLRPLPPKTPRRPQCLRLLPRKRLPAPPTHTLISRHKTSHTDCAAHCAANSAANTKTRPFSRNCAPFPRKTAPKRHPTHPGRERSHKYPVTEQKILAKNQHLLTSFAAIRYPFDTLPVCPQPPAMEAAASRPGHSWARPGPALAPRRRRGVALHHQRPYRALICSTVPLGRRSNFRANLTVMHPGIWGRLEWLVSDSSAASRRLSQTHPHFELHPALGVHPRSLYNRCLNQDLRDLWTYRIAGASLISTQQVISRALKRGIEIGQ